MFPFKNSDEYLYTLEEEIIELLLKKCPECQDNLLIAKSPCTDLSCCGIPYRIYCDNLKCEFMEEDFSLSKLVRKYKK